MDPRGVQAALKLLVQDDKGRRREELNPQQMLVSCTARVASGGGGVAHPMSRFGLRAQKVYQQLFGETRLPSRDLAPQLPGEIARKRLLADRPRLSQCRPRAKIGKSEAALMEEHGRSLLAAVKRVHEGSEAGAADGPLGRIDLPPAKRPRHAMMEAAAAADDMYFKMSSGSEERLDPSEVADAQGDDCAEASKAIAFQKKVLQKKVAVFASAKPGAPVPYVDAKGGLMRPAAKPPVDPGPAPPLPEKCTILFAPGLNPQRRLDSAKYRRRKDGNYAQSTDMVVVSNLHLHFESPEGLFARLHGSCLLSKASLDDPEKHAEERVAFRSFLTQGRPVCVCVHDSFQSQYPAHTDVLVKAADVSPTMSDGKRPRFEVHRLDSAGTVPRATARNRLLVGDSYERPPAEESTADNVKMVVWQMTDLFRTVTLAYASSSSSAAASRSS